MKLCVIFTLLVKLLPHSNFGGSMLLFSLYKLSPKIVRSKKANSLSILVQLVLHNDMASTFCKAMFENCSKPKFSSRPLLFLV